MSRVGAASSPAGSGSSARPSCTASPTPARPSSSSTRSCPSTAASATNLDGAATSRSLVADIGAPRGRRRRRRRRRRVQRRRPGQPPRLDAATRCATSTSTCAATSRSSRRCAASRPTASVVQTSTRQVYGRPRTCPSTRSHPTARSTSTASTSWPASSSTSSTARRYGLRVTALRLTNVYGPRQHLEREGLGFLPVFVRRALLGEEIVLYGDGTAAPRLPARRRRRRRPAAVGDDARRRGRGLQPRPPGLADARRDRPADPARGRRRGGGAAACRGRTSCCASTSAASRATSPRPSGCSAGRRASSFADGIAATVAPLPSIARGPRRRPEAAPPPLRGRRSPTAVDARPRLRARCCSAPSWRRSSASWPRRSTARRRREVVACRSGAARARSSCSTALGIGPGDEVIVPAFTAVPTASAVCAVGATPVPVDVDADDGGHRPGRGRRGASPTATAAIVVVHLYGRPAPVEPLLELGVPVVEDAAQAHGALRRRRRASRRSYSFYPTKNLGGIGDGGAVVTADADLAATRPAPAGPRHDRAVRARRHQPELPHERARGGLAAPAAPDLARRQPPAPRRSPGATATPRPRCAGRPTTPTTSSTSAWSASTTASEFRARARRPRRRHRRPLPAGAHPAAGVPAVRRHACPEAEAWAAECVSLPCFPELTDDEVERRRGGAARSIGVTPAQP